MPIRLEDLSFGRLLGDGSFAQVFHAADAASGAAYAVKVLEKRQIKAQERENAARQERDVLASLGHPGVVFLHAAFQDAERLYFVLELVAGGELAAVLAQMGRCSADFTRFYAAEIVSTLDYLRAKRVAHRDLKPENLLLSSQGHLKLIDFETAVEVPPEGSDELVAAEAAEDEAGACGWLSFAGTSLYLPPEVLQGEAMLREAFASDLWALGCIIFEMLAGEAPFHSASQYTTFQRILRGDFTPPRDAPAAARELIAGLLVPRPAMRIGMGPAGLSAVKQHFFFGGSTKAFERLVKRKPPALPPARLPGDLQQPEAALDCEACCLDCPTSRTGSLGSLDGGPTSSDPSTAPGSPRAARRCGKVLDTRVLSMASTRATLSGNDTDMSQSFRDAAFPLIPQPASTLPSGLTSPAASASAGTGVQAGSQHYLRAADRHRMPEEAIAFCGPVVCRKLPCFPRKILMLTDAPRVLVLNSSGRRLLYDFNVARPGGGEAGRSELAVAVQSPTDFVVRVARHTFRCRDTSFGSRQWELKVASILAPPA